MSDIMLESRIAKAVSRLVRLKSPSVEKILRSHGYKYEANVIRGITRAYQKELDWPKPPENGSNA
jgi:hypothetical protein